MSKGVSDKAGLTSGQVSGMTGLPLQTLIRWDRSGVLKATNRRRPASAQRRYDEDGVVAALAGYLLPRMGFTGSLLARLVTLMQTGDRQTLEGWMLWSYTGSIRGFISHDCGADVGPHLERLRNEDQLVGDPTDLWTIREALLEMARKLIAGQPGLRGED